MESVCPTNKLNRCMLRRILKVSGTITFMFFVNPRRATATVTSKSSVGPIYHVGLLVKVSTADEEVVVNDIDFASAVYSSTSSSVQKQLNACSLQRAPTLVPYRNNETDVGEIMTVILPEVSASYNRTSIVIAATDSVERQLQLGTNIGLRDVVKFTVFCVPHGLSGQKFLASGALNSFWIVAKPSACTNSRVLLHEFGHVYGLKHARQDVEEYGDETSIMGIASNQQNRCFNGYNFWKLGWFNNDYSREVMTTADHFLSTKFSLESFVNGSTLQSAQQHRVVLLKVDSYYLVYNRQESYNNETGDFPNMVTVARAMDTDDSDLVAGLNETHGSNIYQYTNTNMERVTIQICNRFQGNATTVGHYTVAIGIDRLPCRSARTNDITASPSPTKAPTRTPTTLSNSFPSSQRMASEQPSLAIDPPTAMPVPAKFVVLDTNSPSRSTTNKPQFQFPSATTTTPTITLPHQATSQKWHHETPTPTIAAKNAVAWIPSGRNNAPTPIGQTDNSVFIIDSTQTPFVRIYNNSQPLDIRERIHQFANSSNFNVIILPIGATLVAFIVIVAAYCCYNGRRHTKELRIVAKNQPPVLPITKQ